MSFNFRYTTVNFTLVFFAFWIGSHMAGVHEDRPFSPPEVIANKNVETTSFTFHARPEARRISTTQEPDADKLIRLLSQIGPLTSEKLFDEMMSRLLALAEKDPNAAIHFAATLKQPFQSQALTGILGVWAANDGASAWNWVKTNQPVDSLLTGTVLNKIGADQPETAWRFATKLATNMPDQAAGLYVSALNGMIHSGKYQDAAQLLDSAILPADAAQSSFGLTGLLASQWAEFAPQEAAQWALTLPEGNVRNQALLALNQSWANADPGEAVQFASRQTDCSERITMLSAGLDSWFRADPKAAGAWVSTYATANAGDYDQLAAALAGTPRLVDVAPENSVAWAMSISDENLKMDSLQKVFAQWFRGADVNAMAYLKQMPAATQDELCRRLGIVNRN